MPGRLSFAFAKGALVPTGAVEEDDLRLVGLELASTQDPPAYSFSSMGGWNPGLRASVVRTALFKLAGSGIAAGLMSISPHVGRYTSFSCALCAAVNLVASAFYYQIWLVRLQLYGGEKYDIWTANVGRAQASNQKLVAKQAEHDKHVIYWQEVQTDGMRYADWLCTLVLMTLDLGHLREYLTAVSGGFIPAMRLSKEWLASLQACMMLLASFWRFYCNEARPRPNARKSVNGGTPWCTALIAWTCFLASSVIFGVIVWVMLDGLPAINDVAVGSVKIDIVCLQTLVLVWVGYPLVALASRLAHWNMPGNEYSATWSFIKDISFAFLDVTSKAGLAIFFVLKTTYVDSVMEATLLERANVTHAV